MLGGKVWLCAGTCLIFLSMTNAMKMSQTPQVEAKPFIVPLLGQVEPVLIPEVEEVENIWEALQGEYAYLIPKAPMLLYVRPEKSAGLFLHQYFFEAYKNLSLSYHHPGSTIRNVPANYFVVSSIENPGKQAQGTWSYCCEKAWVQENLGINDAAAACGKTTLSRGECPKYSGSKTDTDQGYELQIDDLNTNGFEEFLNRDGGYHAAIYEMQLNKTFEEVGLDRVNCWIRVENVVQDMRSCMEQYEQYSGVKASAAAIKGLEAMESAKMKQVTSQDDHNCETNFKDAPQAEQTVRKQNSFLLNYFGYSTMCN